MSGLRDHLQTIYDEFGKLTPALVVEAARPDNHPLHDRLEWDDGVAGEAYRRYQAHELIQSIRIVHERAGKEPLSVRAFHAIRDDEGHTYRSTEDVLADPFLTKMLLADMKREWTSLRSRYEHFAEFRELVLGDFKAAS